MISLYNIPNLLTHMLCVRPLALLDIITQDGSVQEMEVSGSIQLDITMDF